MNRWLYRAVGTVGIAGGALVFGAGAAQADQTDLADPALADVFSPTSGLPPLDLTGPDRTAPGTAGAGELRLDPADGRLGQGAGAEGEPAPEVLPGLPGLPGLDSLLGGLPLGGLPLDGLPLDGLPLDGLPLDGLPLAGLPVGGPGSPQDQPPPGEAPLDGLPVDGLPVAGLPLDAVGVPGGSVGAGVPLDGLATFDGQAIGLPTDAGAAAEADRPAEVIGPMPFLAKPLSDALLDGRSLGEVVTVGNLTSQVPVAGPMVGQTAGNLPLVSDVVPAQQTNVSDPRNLPAHPATPGRLDPAAAELRPVIADQLAAEGRFSPEITGAVPLLGPALEPVGKMVGVGNLADQLPLVGPVAGSALGSLPMIEPTAGPALDPAAPAPDPTGPTPDPTGVGGDERPVTGDDPEFAPPPGLPVESRAASSAEQLPVGPAGPAGPVSGLTQGLPVPLPLEALRSLPVLGQLTGGLPV
ncbi:MAG: hypothetical protein GEV12_04650 [Micromonosporaceae bacterium]|nr:hypothetical protein [Micromonosporaceae bacterium]